MAKKKASTPEKQEEAGIIIHVFCKEDASWRFCGSCLFYRCIIHI